MRPVTIYTRPFCSYCSRALNVLRQKGVEVTEIDAGFDAAARKEMLARSNGGSTYPQIFVGERHIGGCDDMLALERAGKLDELLSA
jgi:glutaredoxin 3